MDKRRIATSDAVECACRQRRRQAHGVSSSSERCAQLLARRVARDEGAVQPGVPVSCNAMCTPGMGVN